ncbi:Valine--tRNA ligase, partial [Fragariocoptes setiger]
METTDKPLTEKQKAKLAKLEKFRQKQEKLTAEAGKSTAKAPKVAKVTKALEEALVIDVPPGEKKNVTNTLASAYNPKAVEHSWYDWWENQRFFKPEYVSEARNCGDSDCSKREKFVMVIPPPNVTGTLHLGHALTCAIQDSLTRWNRMRGVETLWNPGCDHAGIATQVVVEKKIQREMNLDRHQLGREKFVQEVWKWKNEKGGDIYQQLRRMGCSVDWDRAVFTLDPKMSRAVTEAFVRLHEMGLIYRAERLVNWSSKLKSAISDIEVDHEELTDRKLIQVPGHDKPIEFGIIETFAYEICDANGVTTNQRIWVATTRLETMLGDTAIAVNPEDDRYKQFIGKQAHHPFCERKITVVADEYVDKEFGTGAVKITPAHDVNDYEIAKRHKLPFINIFTDDGRIENGFSKFSGLMRFDVRLAIRAELRQRGLIVDEPKVNPMVVPRCSRSKDVIEPRLKYQWYVDCKEMAKRAADAAREKKLKLIPEIYLTTWYGWLDNIRDWCVSRQLWWGHRIPAYLAKDKRSADDKVWIVSRTNAEAKASAMEKLGLTSENDLELTQDEDVLDTWFSSGLFPFAIFGWPELTPDLKNYFPGHLLETGKDIIFFWVARMVMLSLTLTGQLPFSEVLLHSIVRDAHGRKMSKSLGNVIDPLDVISGITLNDLGQKLIGSNLDPKELERALQGQKADFPQGIPECGTDALRFCLCAYITSGVSDINLDIKRVEGDRHFCNKIWNACRFAFIMLGDEFDFDKLDETSTSWEHKSEADRLMLRKMIEAIRDVNKGYEAYDFRGITITCRSFWRDELCDKFIEHMKKIRKDASITPGQMLASKHTLFMCMHVGLRLLHPIMPFVTEELYQRLVAKFNHPETVPSICVARFPEVHHYNFASEALALKIESTAESQSEC